MEKIKFSYIRSFFFIFILMVSLYGIFKLLNPNFKLNPKLIISYFLILFSMNLFMFLYDWLKKGPFFTSEKVIIDLKKNIFINWENVIIELDGHESNFLNLGIIYLKSNIEDTIKTKLELNWSTELSAVPILKKYVPKDHDLYILVEDYAKKRGLKL
ncbi:MAG: hypothetical protein ACXVLQ_15995 [Bacteriovorax sp.]